MNRRLRWLWLASLAAAACGGASADAPLTAPVGVSRDQLAGQLRRLEYCAGEAPAGDVEVEVFRRCDVPGHEYMLSWVVAHYAPSGRVWKLQRYERYSEERRGLERFNTLVEKRSATAGPPSDHAKARITARQELPAGTKTWVAFDGGDAVVGVYLLQPRAPQYATILEEIIAGDP